jgi:hypothetical protein
LLKLKSSSTGDKSRLGLAGLLKKSTPCLFLPFVFHELFLLGDVNVSRIHDEDWSSLPWCDAFGMGDC